MWAGRGAADDEDNEDVGKEEVGVGGARGHGEILESMAGAGRRGGGEERAGDP